MNIGENSLLTGNCPCLQTAICSSTPCIKSRRQGTYLHQSKCLLLIIHESLNQKLKLNLGCNYGNTVGCKQMTLPCQVESNNCALTP